MRFSIKNIVFYLLLLAPIGLAMRFLSLYALNLPFGDDLMTLKFFLDLQETTTVSEKISLFFAQHNEHRIVLTRIIAWLQYKMTGEIDLRYWNWSALGSLGIILIVFYRHLQKKQAILLILPLSWLLFAPISYSNLLVAMQNSNFFILVFAVLTLYCLQSARRYALPLAFLSSFLAMFSNGGGYILLLVGALVLIIQKRFDSLAAWLIWSVALLFAYFYGFHAVSYHPAPLDALRQEPQTVVLFFCNLLGSIAKWQILAAPLGIILVFIFVLITYLQYYKKNIFIYSVLFFCFLVAASASLTRASFGAEVGLLSKYSIYGVVILMGYCVVAYQWLREKTEKTTYFLYPLLAISVGINLFFNFRPYNQKIKAMIVAESENYALTGGGFSCANKAIANELEKQHIFSLKKRPCYTKNEAYYTAINAKKQDYTVQIDSVFIRENDILIQGNYELPQGANTQQFLIFQPIDNPSKYCTEHATIFNLRFVAKPPFTRHFEAVIPQGKLKKGRVYQLKFLVTGDQIAPHQPLETQKKLRLEF